MTSFSLPSQVIDSSRLSRQTHRSSPCCTLPSPPSLPSVPSVHRPIPSLSSPIIDPSLTSTTTTTRGNQPPYLIPFCLCN
ncbi:hypothetical protein E2C01_091725 [Portunus trituberculatus]|uniref:Uncharacterized protein n=1 Tax=Portunus trituberculatus TaxID=210409 RepID=A0A5B7JVU6_PORTR|nr:hypothetical protein [Portunus trituberculatus]